MSIQCHQVKDVILSGAIRSIAKSKDLRTCFTVKVDGMRRSFDSLALAQNDIGFSSSLFLFDGELVLWYDGY